MDTARIVIVVDAANVVGSVPDGWWRDRAGAARRLVARIGDADLGASEVVVVLEGEARGGAVEGGDGAVSVVPAGGHGDDEIAARAREASLPARGCGW